MDATCSSIVCIGMQFFIDIDMYISHTSKAFTFRAVLFCRHLLGVVVVRAYLLNAESICIYIYIYILERI